MSTSTYADISTRMSPGLPQTPRRRWAAGFVRWLGGVAGFFWRWLIGALFCMSYFTGVAVAGWLYRWMQGHVLHNWWRQSKRASEGTFREFCERMGTQAPVPRPRWFLRERITQVMARPAPNGSPAGFWRRLGRAITLPWHSFWLNVSTGVAAVFCTYLLTGWGCLLMYFGWGYGWLNSYHKGYEEAAVGAAVSLIGIALFIAALYYVLMAQVHQAVVGERRAFFDFDFVWRLIRSKPTAYLRLVILVTIVSFPLEIMKAIVFAPFFFGNDPTLTDLEVYHYFWWYNFACCAAFFALLLLVRRVAANIYSAAVLKALGTGRLTRSELPPKIDAWLTELDIHPQPVPSRHPILRAAGAVVGWKYRMLLYVLLFLVGFVFVGKRYVGEFLNYRPVTGFVNHELVQLPAFDLITGTPAGKARP